MSSTSDTFLNGAFTVIAFALGFTFDASLSSYFLHHFQGMSVFDSQILVSIIIVVPLFIIIRSVKRGLRGVTI